MNKLKEIKARLLNADRRIIAIVSFLLIAAVTYIISYDRSEFIKYDDAKKWIEAYSPAKVDKNSIIRVDFTDSLAAMINNRKTDETIFRFSPSVAGKNRIIENGKTIIFEPKNGFDQGRNYDCFVDLGCLAGNDSLGVFKFSFFVEKRECGFNEVRVSVDPDDVSKMIINGYLCYNHESGDSLFNDASLISCDDKQSDISIGKSNMPMSKYFIVRGISRLSEGRKVKISNNMMDGFSRAEVVVDIPSLDDFGLITARRIEAIRPYIDLEFSSPLMADQDLEGLITIDETENIKIERNGTNVRVYLGSNGFTKVTLRVSELLKNRDGRRLGREIRQDFEQEVIPPAVKLSLTGSILPDNQNLRLPFKAVNLAAVDVEVAKIKTDNVLRYFQNGSLNYGGELRRFGQLIYHKTIRLDRDKNIDLHKWQNFSIDLRELFRRERGAIYNVRLSFRKAYSLYDKERADDFEEIVGITEQDRNTWSRDYAYIYRDAPDYSWYNYDWRDKDDPSKDTYYMIDSRMPEYNIVASTLGLIVKRTHDTTLKCAVTDIMKATPCSGIKVRAYNYQLDVLGEGVTDVNGFADVRCKNTPFIVTATDGVSTTYLKIDGGNELSTSKFDVDGVICDDGIKGYVYGERGIWRPGDDIYLTLVIEDREHRLPSDYPVQFELYNPDNNLYEKHTSTQGMNGMYVFQTSTEESVPTGLWTARFKVGNQTFHHPVRIETIKPNRLKMNIIAPDIICAGKQSDLGIDSRWLSGPVASNLSARLEMELSVDHSPFDGYEGFTFRNPLIDYKLTNKVIADGYTDINGRLRSMCVLDSDINTPGILNANLIAKVNEPGGDQSITSRIVKYSPFDVYVGVHIDSKGYDTGRDIDFDVVAVNDKATPVNIRTLDYKIYKLQWSHWWESSASELSRYVKSSSSECIEKGVVNIKNGHGSIKFKVENQNWGRYLILVRDGRQGHATGGIFTVDMPGWNGQSNEEQTDGSTELSFTLDKESYNVGDICNIYLPKCKDGRVLISIENGSEIIRRFWTPCQADKNTVFKLPVTKDMAPNFYISATMLQPHAATVNNMPIRLFGVRGARVVNTKSILHPEITMPDELSPQSSFTIRIRERDNKPMTYTLAIVDEGLLDITGFQTPDPWRAMNRKEALGISTWDMYDDIAGAFDGRFHSLLSIGGDMALRRSAGKEKRFNPVVKFMGPFTLKGGEKLHKVTLPMYVGSVRVMVVAAHNGCYGSADRTVKVSSPVMTLTTLPRLLSCGDKITMPVNVFSLDNVTEKIDVSVETSGPIAVSGLKNRSMMMGKRSERLVDFNLVCDRVKTGTARIIVNATDGNTRSSDTTFVRIENRQPVISETIDTVIDSSGPIKLSFARKNIESASLQLSTVPTFDFNGAFHFFEEYPHECTEQLSSKVIFMLSVRDFVSITERNRIDSEIPSLVKRIECRQITDGSFCYWPGYMYGNEWVSNIAGLALNLASDNGFRVNETVLERCYRYQEAMARNYRYIKDCDLLQAFRLYMLARGGKQSIAAMNRLKESKVLSRSAAYVLASAYSIIGRNDISATLLERAERSADINQRRVFVTMSLSRSLAMECYSRNGRIEKAIPLAVELVKECKSGYYVTQDIALSALAIRELIKINGKGGVSVTVAEPNHSPVTLAEINGIKSVELAPTDDYINVSTTGKVYSTLTTSYRPSAVDIVDASSDGIELNIVYEKNDGYRTRATSIKQGAEIKAVVTVRNITGNDIDNMSLLFAVPACWEIWNDRIINKSAGPDNIDIRDDGIYSYFSLEAGEIRQFKFRFRAAYCGTYMMPSAVCEDMYNPAVHAISSNMNITVTK